MNCFSGPTATASSIGSDSARLSMRRTSARPRISFSRTNVAASAQTKRPQNYAPRSIECTAGWPWFALHHSHGGCPILAFFCKGGWRCCRRNFCPFYTTRCGCRRRTRSFDFAQGRLFAKYAEERGTQLWWLLQFEGRATRPGRSLVNRNRCSSFRRSSPLGVM
jgi:hypothetical protein